MRGSELPSRSKWSAFEGLELAAFPRHVFVRGTLAFSEGATKVEAGGAPLALTPPRPRLRAR